ncbi:hypothetical protein ZEAMMB73_Zm00001d016178 [Zea mays]|uniref:Uncharacterized protein n=1 Tax=Zea mays TaxID=4577 RepID=A0A1D6H651_MAIZE|nr:hypothetical protein ZEAMMB73_Zm00001d016178 [Zea mays]
MLCLPRLWQPRLQDRVDFSSLWRWKIRLDASVMLSKGNESLLIPDNAQVISSSVVDRCPHRSETQSVAHAEGEDDCLILGTIDSYGHLIVSRLDIMADGNFTIL